MGTGKEPGQQTGDVMSSKRRSRGPAGPGPEIEQELISLLQSIINHKNHPYLICRIALEFNQIAGITNYTPEELAERRTVLERDNIGTPEETAVLDAILDGFYKDNNNQSYIL
jgi:hypothetical protein